MASSRFEAAARVAAAVPQGRLEGDEGLARVAALRQRAAQVHGDVRVGRVERRCMPQPAHRLRVRAPREQESAEIGGGAQGSRVDAECRAVAQDRAIAAAGARLRVPEVHVGVGEARLEREHALPGCDRLLLSAGRREGEP